MPIFYYANWYCNSSALLAHLECPLITSPLYSYSLLTCIIFLSLNYGVSTSLKGFHDLGLGMNLRLRFILFSSLAFHFLDWLHVDYIGNRIDSILSLSFKIYPLAGMQNGLHLSLWRHKLLCQYCVTRHLIKLLLDTYTYLALSIFLAPEWLDTYSISNLASIATRHLHILYSR